jgi:hypothetical protein
MEVDWWFARLLFDPVPAWFRCLSTDSSQVPSRTANVVRLGAPFRGPDSLQKVAVPQFKDQQAPNFVRVVAASTKVFVEQSPYALRIEVPPLQSSRLQQNRYD